MAYFRYPGSVGEGCLYERWSLRFEARDDRVVIDCCWIVRVLRTTVLPEFLSDFTVMSLACKGGGLHNVKAASKGSNA